MEYRWTDMQIILQIFVSLLIIIIYIFIYLIYLYNIIILLYAKRYTELGPSEKHWFYRLRNCYRPHTFAAAHPLNHGHPLPAPVCSATAATAAVCWRVRAILGHIVLIFRHAFRRRRGPDDATSVVATVATATATTTVDRGHGCHVVRLRLPSPPV